MKKTTTQLFVLAIFLTPFLTGCDAGKLNSKAEATASDYYSSLQKKNYTAALGLCSNTAFNTTTKDEWIKSLETNAGLLGEIISFTKTSGFNIEASTSTGTTIRLMYDVQWQYGKSKDSVLLIKEKDGSMKIYRYTWQHADTKYMAELSESEKQAAAYMDAIKAGNYDAAIAFCSKEALAATPKERWASFLQNATDKLGNISGYDIVKDSSVFNIAATGQSGKGNYYDIFIQSNRGNTRVMEKVVYFQENYNGPLKLAGHYFL